MFAAFVETREQSLLLFRPPSNWKTPAFRLAYLNGGSAMSRQQRRHFSPEQKVAIVKRHLLEGVPVSDLCDEHQISPNLFYLWQRQLFENAHSAFENGRTPKVAEQAKERKIEQLEAKLVRKNEVMAELMEAHT